MAADTRRMLLDLLQQVDQGRIVSVYGVVEYSNANFGTFGSSTMSRLATAGALMDAAVRRLGYINEND